MKRVALNGPVFPEFNFTMKSISFNRLPYALVLPLLLALPAATQGAYTFTNTTVPVLPRRASIILIQCEGLGYGDLSCYGQKNFQTPIIDKLATEGVRFTNYSIIGPSVPTCASLMLGRDQAHLRQATNSDLPLATDETTVAQILKSGGYHTGMVGEWNLGDENSSGAPWKKGFDEFAGYLNAPDAANFYADYIFRYAPGLGKQTTPDSQAVFIGREMIYHNTAGMQGKYIPEFLTDCALNFIKNHVPDHLNNYQPFFLVLDYKIPGAGKSQVQTDAPFSEEQWPQPAKNKAAMIAHLDGDIARIQEQLQKYGMTNNAVVFFTSSSLPQTNAVVAPSFFKSTLSPNDLRAPMIVWWPGHIPAGQVSDYPCSAADFLPTAADIGLVRPPAGINGTTFLPALLGQGN